MPTWEISTAELLPGRGNCAIQHEIQMIGERDCSAATTWWEATNEFVGLLRFEGLDCLRFEIRCDPPAQAESARAARPRLRPVEFSASPQMETSQPLLVHHLPHDKMKRCLVPGEFPVFRPVHVAFPVSGQDRGEAVPSSALDPIGYLCTYRRLRLSLLSFTLTSLSPSSNAPAPVSWLVLGSLQLNTS